MYYLLYCSKESIPFNKKSLKKLLDKAQENNQAKDITGLLIYRYGTFIQFLEGDKKTIQSLFDKIAKDKRHTEIEILDEGEKELRLFPH